MFKWNLVLSLRRCISGSLLRDVSGRRDSSVLHGACSRSIQQEGCYHLLGSTGTAFQRQVVIICYKRAEYIEVSNF